VYSVLITPNKISITYNKPTSLYLILSTLYYYFNEHSCIISQIVLISDRNGCKWYNNITDYKNKHIIYLFFRLKGEYFDFDHSNSHITDSEFNNNVVIEIHTLNINNNRPKIIPKKKFLKKIIKDWENHM
jgi:hypothetical protein